MSTKSNYKYHYKITYLCSVKRLPSASNENNEAYQILGEYFNDNSQDTTNYGSIAIDKSINIQLLRKILIEQIEYPSNNAEGLKGRRQSHCAYQTLEDYIDGYKFFLLCNYDNSQFYVVVISNRTPKSLAIRLLQYLEEHDPSVTGSTITDINNRLKEIVITVQNDFNKEVEDKLDINVDLERDLQDVIKIMNDNIDKVLLRNDKMDSLVNKTHQLNNSGVKFRRRAIQLKRKMWFQKVKFKAVISIILISLIGGVILFLSGK
ncbi:uncharacterized protein SCODWIG_02732 [Saccharomycodes ludwigii]|uniref:V-SNARE coiled-coil homology domain-containing protein n=1 Tax=Saccharomycodes ludwigii TaxID=36035 RepID=A0A376B8N2_9ASCO|nr:hypothetical protein SCDLUD_001713 [Saccharomycodes ludwigii]KAH3901928.1 hypothetical protein SCDLUD_001713 [Saccharomycodes ludwigii]SSD60971.1 uncharacterized protein SCODWIG_02732 [Saccharomycodes ludwigii]